MTTWKIEYALVLSLQVVVLFYFSDAVVIIGTMKSFKFFEFNSCILTNLNRTPLLQNIYVAILIF